MGNCHTRQAMIHRYRNNEEDDANEVGSTSTFSSDKERHYRFIDGQRYHNTRNSVYGIPYSERECERLTLQHFMYRYIWQSNFSSMVDRQLTHGSGVKVLDVGCGPGTWLIEMAADFPRCHFTGIDITPMMFPDLSPINTQFLKGDLLDGLPFDEDTFDLVNMRFLSIAFTEQQWKTKVIKELFRVLKPGGWLEIMFADLRYKNLGNNGKIFFESWFQEMHSRFINPQICHELESMLSSTNAFQNITLEKRLNPIGEWGGRLGKVAADNFILLMRAIESRLTNLMCISPEGFQELIEIATHEFNENKTYGTSYRCYSQKRFECNKGDISLMNSNTCGISRSLSRDKFYGFI